MEQNGFPRKGDPWHLHAGADHSIRHIFKRHLPEQDGEVDKAPAISIMDATKLLPDEGLPPVRIISLCFGHDEELSDMRIASITTQWSREQGTLPALVLYQDGLIENSRLPEGNPNAILPIMKNRLQSDSSQIKKIAPHPHHPGPSRPAPQNGEGGCLPARHQDEQQGVFFEDAYQVKMEECAA